MNMTVKWLVKMLVADVEVIVKDAETGSVYYIGKAADAEFSDKVKGWDFSEKPTIYI